MNVNHPVIVRLRQELQTARDDLNKYIDLYRRERSDRREQESICINLRKENHDLLQNNELLHERLDKVMQHIDNFQIPKPYKKWENLQSAATKAKRKCQYHRCLEQSMMYLHEATRARVQLRVGEKEVFFVWSTNDLCMLRNQAKTWEGLSTNNNQSSSNEGNEFIDAYDSEDEDQIQSVDTDLDVYLPNGSWNTTHLRRILHVMDIFKISYKAYHELRMTSRSILPPLNKLKVERNTMSNEITSLHHKTVNIQYLVLTP